MSDVSSPRHLLSKESAEALINNFPTGIVALFDSELRFISVGPESRLPATWSASKFIGKRVGELFSSRIEQRFQATLDGEDCSFNEEFLGDTYYIETRRATVDDELHVLMVAQSLSDIEQATEEPEQQDQPLDKFASMVSHDLRNHLNVARGRLGLFRETGDESHLGDVESALERIEELTTDFTVLAQNGSTEDGHESVLLDDVARDAWAATDTRSATLQTRDVEFIGNRGPLQALFENLFRNAVGHGGSDVTVRVGPLNDGFYVEDTGTGIPPEHREDVFKHGFTTSYSGDGVGLAIVGRIAEAHSLTVSLSESQEGGCRFEFSTVDDAG